MISWHLEILKDCMSFGDFGGGVGMATDNHDRSPSFRMAFNFWLNFIIRIKVNIPLHRLRSRIKVLINSHIHSLKPKSELRLSYSHSHIRRWKFMLLNGPGRLNNTMLSFISRQ